MFQYLAAHGPVVGLRINCYILQERAFLMRVKYSLWSMYIAIILLKEHSSKMTTNIMLFFLVFLAIVIDVATNIYTHVLYDHIFLAVYGTS